MTTYHKLFVLATICVLTFCGCKSELPPPPHALAAAGYVPSDHDNDVFVSMRDKIKEGLELLPKMKQQRDMFMDRYKVLESTAGSLKTLGRKIELVKVMKDQLFMLAQIKSMSDDILALTKFKIVDDNGKMENNIWEIVERGEYVWGDEQKNLDWMDHYKTVERED